MNESELTSESKQGDRNYDLIRNLLKSFDFISVFANINRILLDFSNNRLLSRDPDFWQT